MQLRPVTYRSSDRAFPMSLQRSVDELAVGSLYGSGCVKRNTPGGPKGYKSVCSQILGVNLQTLAYHFGRLMELSSGAVGGCTLLPCSG